jgi:transcriptional regulator GlxA family with amidase domain
MSDAGHLIQEFEAITEYFSPRVIAIANGQYVKLAKFKGEFPFHAHTEEDEFFLVHRGEFTMCYRDREVVLKAWQAHITAPSAEVTSMNGVTVQRQRPLEFASEADAVIIGSGFKTREIVADAGLLSRIRLDPSRQLIGAQCSGTLLLAKLGLIGELPACTDLTTKPWVIEAGVRVLDAPFVAHGNVATAGGCLASHYLAAWMIARGASLTDMQEAVGYVAPVGEKSVYVEQATAVIVPFVTSGKALKSTFNAAATVGVAADG